MQEFDHIIKRERERHYTMRNEALFAFFLQAKISAEQARQRPWRRLAVTVLVLLLPATYLLTNFNTLLELYLGAVIRSVVPSLINGTLLSLVLALILAWLGLIFSRR